MVTLRIKKVNRVSTRPPDPHLALSTSKQSMLRPGDHRVGYVLRIFVSFVPQMKLCRFGDEVPSFEQVGYTWMVRPFEPGSTAKTPSTYVTFVFRYRSRGNIPFYEPYWWMLNRHDRILAHSRNHSRERTIPRFDSKSPS